MSAAVTLLCRVMRVFTSGGDATHFTELQTRLKVQYRMCICTEHMCIVACVCNVCNDLVEVSRHDIDSTVSADWSVVH